MGLILFFRNLTIISANRISYKYFILFLIYLIIWSWVLVKFRNVQDWLILVIYSNVWIWLIIISFLIYNCEFNYAFVLFSKFLIFLMSFILFSHFGSIFLLIISQVFRFLEFPLILIRFQKLLLSKIFIFKVILALQLILSLWLLILIRELILFLLILVIIILAALLLFLEEG